MWEGGLSSNGEVIFFFFNDTATTEICTLSLHDALPISRTSRSACGFKCSRTFFHHSTSCSRGSTPDRKSTRLNSSHDQNSDAVFCLKKCLTRVPNPLECGTTIGDEEGKVERFLEKSTWCFFF